jgi:CDP-diacylglycerol--glycerol-3-phosphate 3-phosphatidyltransferase
LFFEGFRSKAPALQGAALYVIIARLEEIQMRLADKFTLVRIIYAPLFLAIYFIAAHNEDLALPVLVFGTVLLIFAEITDYLDGSTARRLNQVSDTGKILDPFADALLHITTFFCFVTTNEVPAVIFMLIFYREFSMLFLRLYATKKGLNIAARMGGKLKTVLYITTGFFILAQKIYGYAAPVFALPALPSFLVVVRVALCAVCVFAAYLSFGEYIYRWVILSKRNA